MINDVLKALNILDVNHGTSTGQSHFSSDNAIVKDIYSPVDGALVGKVKYTTPAEYEKVITTAAEAFKTWRKLPAPKRGEVVRKE